MLFCLSTGYWATTGYLQWQDGCSTWHVTSGDWLTASWVEHSSSLLVSRPVICSYLSEVRGTGVLYSQVFAMPLKFLRFCYLIFYFFYYNDNNVCNISIQLALHCSRLKIWFGLLQWSLVSPPKRMGIEGVVVVVYGREETQGIATSWNQRCMSSEDLRLHLRNNKAFPSDKG